MIAATRAAWDVVVERQRQREMEGFDDARDDAYVDGSLAMAAAFFAVSSVDPSRSHAGLWPPSWSPSWMKRKGRRHELVVAGALILAEIERLDRARVRGRSQDEEES